MTTQILTTREHYADLGSLRASLCTDLKGQNITHVVLYTDLDGKDRIYFASSLRDAKRFAARVAAVLAAVQPTR